MKPRHWLSPLLLGLASCLPYAATSAQSIGIHQEQLQRERERILRQQLELTPYVVNPVFPSTEATPLSFPEEEQPCSRIDALVLQGKAAQDFQFALSEVRQPANEGGALGRCLGGRGIQMVIARVQSAIIERGFTTTRVLVQPQDLSSGTLVLTLAPGRVRKLRMAEDADPRGTLLNALPLSEGDILNLRAIEQGLENLKRLPTVQADIQITPSQEADAQDGDSDLVVQYQQALPFRFSSSLDDGGTRASGRYQAGVTLTYDNWWTLNDLFYVSLNRSLGRYGDRGNRSHTVHYSLPFGDWLLSATSSASRYHQTVAGAFESVRYSGESESGELKLSRLVQRDGSSKTSLAGKLLLRRSLNFIDGIVLGPQQRRMSAWELSVHHRHFIGSAVLEGNLGYRRALDRQGQEAQDELDLPQIVSRYALWLADAAWNVPWQWGDARLRYSGAARAQWNRGGVPTQDQFAIGGRYTVRGFDGELTLQAERGWLLRNEVALALGASGQEIYAGFDSGAVAGALTQNLTGRRLSGAVLGWRGSLDKLGYELFVATPLARPAGWASASVTGGFNLQWTY
jgi:hemolysin activation/secretion protein